MITTILFDLNQTIITCDELNLDEEWEALTGLTEKSFWKTKEEVYHHYCLGAFSEDELFRKLLESHKLPLSLMEEIKELNQRGLLPVKGMFQIVKDLAKKYKLILVAGEGRGLAEEKMEISGLKDFFSGVYVSAELKMSKEKPDMYRHVLLEEQIDAKECLFIDDLPNYLSAAKEAGIQGVLFTDAKELKKDLQKLSVL